MSSKKRATTALKSFGAAGLAAATIVSGLSFGPAAATASAPASPGITAAGSESTNSVSYTPVWKYGSQFAAIVNEESTAYVRAFGTKAEAERASRSFVYDAQSKRFTSQGRCMGLWGLGTGSGGTVFAVGGLHGYYCDITFPNGRMTFHDGTGAEYRVQGPRVHYGGLVLALTTGAGIPTETETPNDSVRALDATVGAVDNIAKTAVVSGKATPGAKVSIGSQETTADSSDGSWSITVTGLKNGANELTAIQKVNGTEVDRKTVTATIVEGGTLVPGTTDPVNLERGATTDVPFTVKNNETRSDMVGTVELTAPTGTTFDTTQTTVAAKYRTGDSGSWNSYAKLDMKNAAFSDNNTKVRFAVDTDGGNMVSGEQYRYTLKVITPANAQRGDSTLNYTYAGTSDKGAYRAQGSTSTKVNTAALTAKVDSVDNIAKSAAVSGTATPGAKVTIGNQEADVNSAGNWNLTVTGLKNGANTLAVIQKLGSTEIDRQSLTVNVQELSTTLGFHGITATPDAGTFFTNGTEGVVKWKPQPSSGNTGIDVKNNESFSWSLTLPKGYRANGLPAKDESATWKNEWTAADNSAGEQVVTLTITNVSGRTLTGQATTQPDRSFKIKANAAPAADTTITGRFTPPPSYSSSSPQGTATLKAATALTAKVDSFDNIAKTAVVSGTATKGAEIAIGNQKTTASQADGSWSITVTNLADGENSLTAVQTAGGARIDSRNLTVTIVDGGGIIADSTEKVALKRGTTTTVPVTVKTTVDRTNPDGSITFTAPAGTTFAGADDAAVEYKKPGEEWKSSAYLNQTEGSLSADRKTLTYKVSSTGNFTVPEGSLIRLSAKVATPSDVNGSTGSVGYTFTGTSGQGNFSAAGNTATEIRTIADLVIGAPVNGSTVTVPRPTFSGTGDEGATIRVESAAGLTIAETTVVDGKWSVPARTDLTDGSYTLSVTQTPTEGNPVTKQVSFTVDIAVNGGLSIGDAGTTELNRGGNAGVPFVLHNDRTVTRYDGGQIVFTAPEGTTFPAQTTAPAHYRQSSADSWKVDRRFDLKGGTVSNDGKTITFDWTPTSSTGDASNLDRKWTIQVATPAGAPIGNTSMGGHITGSTDLGTIDLTGSSATKVTTAALTAAVGSVDNDAKTAVVSGKATPGADVTIGDTTVTANATTGDWSITVTGLTNGDNRLTAVQKVGSTEIDRVTVTASVSASDLVIETPANNSTIDTPRPTFSGTGDEGATVTVKSAAGLTIAETTVKDGKWSVPANADLTNGTYTVNVTQTPTAGNPVTKQVTFTVDVPAPVTPLVIESPENNGTVDTKRPTFSGTGDNGATILVKNAAGNTIATTTVQNGKWSVQPTAELPDGRNVVDVTQTPTGGRAPSTERVTFTVDATVPVTPLTAVGAFDEDVTKPATISGAAETGATVIVKDSLGNEVGRATAVDGKYSIDVPPAGVSDGVNDFTVTQTVNGEVSSPVDASLDYGTVAPIRITSPEDGSTVQPTGLTFTGTGDNGAKVTVRGSSSAIASGDVVDGQWSAPVTRQLTNNVYRLWAVQTTKGGRTTNQPITITIADREVVAPLTATAAFNPNDENLPAAISGTAELGATVTVKGADGTVIGTATASSGRYTITIPANKAHFGVNDFTITQTVKGKESAPLNRSLDYGTPAAPVISTPDNGATVVNGSIRFTGTGATGAKLDMRGNVSSIGETRIENGAWVVDANRVLTPNRYDLRAVQTTKGGLTQQVRISVEIRDSAELTATAAFDRTDENLPATIGGSAQNGATVTVKAADGSTIGTATAANGRYSITVPANKAHFGVNEFTVTQTVNGKVSTPVDTSLDYGNPVAPVISTPENGATVVNGEIRFTGTGATGAKLEMRGNVSAIGTSTVRDGAWTVDVTRQLTPNVYALHALQTSKGGLTQKVDIRVVVTNESIAPITAQAAFDTTDENLPAKVSGSAQTGATVTVKAADGSTVGTATAANGRYSITIPVAKAHFGVNDFTATQTVKGKTSAPVSTSLDYGNPAAPVILTPDNGATVTNGSIRFTGTGATGAKLDMRGNVSSLGDTKVTDGAWAVDVKRDLKPTVYALHALQTSKGGLTKKVGIRVTVEDKKVAELTAAGKFDDNVERNATIGGKAQDGATVVVREGARVIGTTTAADGEYSVEVAPAGPGVRTFTVTQTVGGVVSPAKTATLDYGTAAPVVVQTPADGDRVSGTGVTFTGTGAAGSKVVLGGTSSRLGEATVNDEGNWSITIERTLSPQLYTMYTKQITKGNLIGDAVTTTITVTR
ncbi:MULTISPECIES: Ig-like domain-containing protein [unclassified Curtobacterium]|uniref:Ig-like domain-containing protein n=1 Tax=unclassified Curtobacterium TaxID=257496 RepID=UPI0016117806|nr:MULTISPECIES: Ig-like domain-containing protein [unclassified Curtobacterium]